MDKAAQQLRILMLEDVPTDAELVTDNLREEGLEFTTVRVDSEEAFTRALQEFAPHIVLADYRLPTYNGRTALEYTRRMHPQIPVVMVTGALGEEEAVALLKLGAKDYVLKDNLVRLASAVKRAIAEENGIRNRKLAEGKYRTLFTEARDGIVLLDCDTNRVMDCNPEFERQSGRVLDRLRGVEIWALCIPETRENVQGKFAEIREGMGGASIELDLQRPDGSTVIVEFVSEVSRIQDMCFIQGLSHDITERLRAERALRESEDKFRSIASAAQDAIIMMDNGGKLSYMNAAAEKIFGYPAAEALGQEMHSLLAPGRFHNDFHNGFQRFRETGEGPIVGKTVELAALRKDGTEFPIELSLSAIKREGLWNAVGIVRDISERRRIEQVIRDEKALSDSLIQSMPGIFFLLDHKFNLLRWNDKVPELLGLPPAELRAAESLRFVHQDDRSSILRSLSDVLEVGSTEAEVRLLSTRGSRDYVVTGTRIETQQGANIVGIGIDITERKQAEDALHRANRALRTLSEANLALVRAKSEEELLHAATRVIVEQGGYCLAAVDYADDNAEKSITPRAWAGIEDTQYWARNLTWADTERGQLPVARAIRGGTTQICRDIAADPGFEPWRESALARGFVSNIALPLVNGGRPFGGLSIFASDPVAFDAEEVRLLEELANDLAYGITTLRTRVAHELQAAALRKGLEQSIQTIAGTVEARDPYTAGHQRRVGELAAAIARALGLPEEQVNGIHLAAIIHDLGKIHIPAEILSKPGRLTEIEYMLIKTHPQAGYNIVKDVKFPWPIADIILQHHERMDGSGYPQGLKGEQILLEARIMTVADVVEAMSSHRPYRPAVGMVAALSEIDGGRATKYDAVIVDVCMKLFTETGFGFGR